MLFHLGRLAHGDKRIAGLTPAQWTVPRYFGGANRVSRTASAFASFHGTTRVAKSAVPFPITRCPGRNFSVAGFAVTSV